jgi:hypothetical protein
MGKVPPHQQVAVVTMLCMFAMSEHFGGGKTVVWFFHNLPYDASHIIQVYVCLVVFLTLYTHIVGISLSALAY